MKKTFHLLAGAVAAVVLLVTLTASAFACGIGITSGKQVFEQAGYHNSVSAPAFNHGRGTSLKNVYVDGPVFCGVTTQSMAATLARLKFTGPYFVTYGKNWVCGYGDYIVPSPVNPYAVVLHIAHHFHTPVATVTR